MQIQQIILGHNHRRQINSTTNFSKRRSDLNIKESEKSQTKDIEKSIAFMMFDDID